MGPFELDSISKLARVSTGHPWLENALVVALFFGIGAWVRPEDPLMTGQIFPWSIFAPMATGLRYGFAHGFVTAVALHVVAAGYGWLGSHGVWPLPFGYTLGLLLCSLIVGEFRDIWEDRLEKLERSNEYRQARMEEFTRSYHLLKISHDELEQEYAGRRTSLRSALLTARERLMTASEQEAGSELLALLGTYISARSAVYHSVSHGRLDPEPVFSVGRETRLVADDPLLVKALQTGATVSVRAEDTASMAARDQGDPIVVVPVADAYREVRAVVGIMQIPFFALTERNLQIASILAGRFGDFLHAGERLTVRTQDDLYWFLYQTLRCLDLAGEHGLSSCLLTCRLTDPGTAPAYIQTIRAQARGLDEAISWQEDGRQHLLLLLPLTGKLGLERFMVRFDSYLGDSHGVGLNRAGIEVSHHLLQASDGIATLCHFLAGQLGEDSELIGALETMTAADASSGKGHARVLA